MRHKPGFLSEAWFSAFFFFYFQIYPNMTKDNFSPYGPGKISGTYKFAISATFSPAGKMTPVVEMLKQNFDKPVNHNSPYRESVIKEDLVTFKVEKNFVLVTLNVPDDTPLLSFISIVFASRYVSFSRGEDCTNYVQYLDDTNCHYEPADEHKPHYLVVAIAGNETATLLRTPQAHLFTFPKHTQTFSSQFHEITPEALEAQLFNPDKETTGFYKNFLIESSNYTLDLTIPQHLVFLMCRVVTGYLLKAASYELFYALNPLPKQSPQAKLYATEAADKTVASLKSYLSTDKYKQLQELSNKLDRETMFIMVLMNVLSLTGYMETLIARCIAVRTTEKQQVPLGYLLWPLATVVPTGTLTVSHSPVVLKPLSGYAEGTVIDYVIRPTEVDAFIQQPGQQSQLLRELRISDVEQVGNEPTGFPTTNSRYSPLGSLAVLAALTLASGGTTAAIEQTPVNSSTRKNPR